MSQWYAWTSTTYMKWSNFRKMQWPKLTQEKVDNVGTHIMCERLSQKLPMKKSPGPDGFTIKFYQTFHEEVMQLFYKLSPQETEVTFPISFCDARVSLIKKLEINITRNEQTVFTLEIQGGLTLKTN